MATVRSIKKVTSMKVNSGKFRSEVSFESSVGECFERIAQLTLSQPSGEQLALFLSKLEIARLAFRELIEMGGYPFASRSDSNDQQEENL